VRVNVEYSVDVEGIEVVEEEMVAEEVTLEVKGGETLVYSEC